MNSLVNVIFNIIFNTHLPVNVFAIILIMAAIWFKKLLLNVSKVSLSVDKLHFILCGVKEKQSFLCWHCYKAGCSCWGPEHNSKDGLCWFLAMFFLLGNRTISAVCVLCVCCVLRCSCYRKLVIVEHFLTWRIMVMK